MLYSSLKRFGRVEQHSNLSEPLHSWQSSQLAWSDHGSTHSNISEPLHSLSKQQRERSDRGSTQLNLSEPLHSLSKQQLLCESSVGFDSSEPLQTTVWRSARSSKRFRRVKPHRTLNFNLPPPPFVKYSFAYALQ